MRRMVAILMLAALMLAIQTAFAAEEPAALTFAFSGYELQRDIVTLPNGNILVAGDTRMGDKDQKLSDKASMAWIFCLNPAGQVIWERRDGTPGLINIYADPAVLENGNILVKMHVYKKGDVDSEQWQLVELTQDGAEANTIKIADADATRELLPCTQGYFHVAVDNEGNYIYTLYDREGKQLWRAERGNLLRSLDTAISLPVGTLLLGQKSKYENTATALMMDGSGSPLWTLTAAVGESSFFDKALVTGGGNLLLLGHASLPAVDGLAAWQLFAVCYSPDGEILWQREYEKDEKMYKMEDIMPYGEGYLAVGTSHSNSRLKLLSLDSQGEMLDQWIVRREDTVYSNPALCLINGEPWVCANVQRDGEDVLEFTRAVKIEQ